MKTLLKAVGIALLVLAVLKGIQILADKLYALYGQRYISCEINQTEE